MTRDEKVQYWLDIADRDYVVAKDLMEKKHWLYVGYMCQQAVEKTLKAYHTKYQSDDPMRIHNLVRLAENAGVCDLMTEEQQAFLDVLTPLNIEARYPDYKSRIYASLNETVCTKILEQTKTMQQWIKSKL